MSRTDIERYAAACEYPGTLDETAVERHLAAYLAALDVERAVVRLRAGWTLDQHPALARTVDAIFEDLAEDIARYAAIVPVIEKIREAWDDPGAPDIRPDPSAWDDQVDWMVQSAARDAPARRINRRIARFEREARIALDSSAAQDARNARHASAARAVRNDRSARLVADVWAAPRLRTWDHWGALRGRRRYATWCLQGRFWWDLSVIAVSAIGARECGTPDVERWANPLMDAFIAGACALYWSDDTLFWLAKPVVHRDPAPDTRRLHNDAGAALVCDLENLYVWHGVQVPALVVTAPESITLDDIDRETNVEVRRVLIERYKSDEEMHGAAAWMRDAGATRLDQDERFGILWRRRVPYDEAVVMLEVIDATRGPDGSHKHYWLRVPHWMSTAREAAAWTFDVPAERYAPVVET
jgi:hypothetical protein